MRGTTFVRSRMLVFFFSLGENKFLYYYFIQWLVCIYLFPLAPAGASVLLLFNVVPIASLTSGSCLMVFCTNHSFTFPLILFVAWGSPPKGIISIPISRVLSTSTALAIISNRSNCCLNATSGFAFAGTGEGGWSIGPI